MIDLVDPIKFYPGICSDLALLVYMFIHIEHINYVCVLCTVLYIMPCICILISIPTDLTHGYFTGKILLQTNRPTAEKSRLDAMKP